MPSLVTLLLMLRALVFDRQRLVLENTALRQQVIVLKRSVKRPQARDSDRIFWILMRRAMRDWKSCLLLVQPDTVVRWHRKGWRYYWGRQSRPHVTGRPPIGWKLVNQIQRLSTENPLCGAPRIQADLALLAVTANPTSEWIAGQLREAFLGGEEPRLLLHDRDGAFTGEEFARQLKAMCIRDLLTTAQSPWENCFVERVIGTVRREYTDHITPFGERHLLAVLREYFAYYNAARWHQSLEGNSPLPRDGAPEPAADVRATPVLGGLHHTYERAA